MNNVNLVGRITRDPELKNNTDNTRSYVFFCLAVDGGKDKDGEKITDFIDCIAYNKQAEYIGQYVKKGYLLELGGRIHTSTREDSEGNKTKRVTIVVYNVGILSGGAKTETNKPQPSEPQPSAGAVVDPNTGEPVNELPFEI